MAAEISVHCGNAYVDWESLRWAANRISRNMSSEARASVFYAQKECVGYSSVQRLESFRSGYHMSPSGLDMFEVLELTAE